MPNGLTEISPWCFNDCYVLSSINIPSGVTSIGNYAFAEDDSLQNIIIPSGVTSIGNYAFAYFHNKPKIITFEGTTPPTLGNYALGITDDGGTGDLIDLDFLTIYVPAASVNAYKSAWSEYASRIQAIS